MWRTRFFYGTFGAANLGLVLYGLMIFLHTQILTDSFLEHIYRFPAESSSALTYLAALFRLLGFFNLLVGSLGLWLLWRHRLNPQLWLERTVMMVSLLAYLAPIIFDNTVGYIGFFETLEHLLFTAMLVVGIFHLFTKKEDD